MIYATAAELRDHLGLPAGEPSDPQLERWAVAAGRAIRSVIVRYPVADEVGRAADPDVRDALITCVAELVRPRAAAHLERLALDGVSTAMPGLGAVLAAGRGVSAGGLSITAGGPLAGGVSAPAVGGFTRDALGALRSVGLIGGAVQ